MLNHIREERGGRLNSSEFGARMKGTSEQWKLTERIFQVHCQRLGFNQAATIEKPPTFRRPTRQGTLFA